MGLCKHFTGDEEKAREHWEDSLKFDMHATREFAYGFNVSKARYYQMYSLRGLGRHYEADAYRLGLELFAYNYRIPDNARKKLLELYLLGEEKDITKFNKYDSELGVASLSWMAMTAER